MLWAYGIPNKANREGHSFLILQQVNKEGRRKARFCDRIYYIGLTLLIIGFIIQLFDIFQSR